MPPISGARGSFQPSSPVHIDSNEGGLDIGNFGRFGPILPSFANSNGPFGGEHANTCSEYDACSPRLSQPWPDLTAAHSPESCNGHRPYFNDCTTEGPGSSAHNIHINLPTHPYPAPRSNDLLITNINSIEQPHSPCHLFVRYHYPHAKEPPMPSHYKFLDRSRVGDMDHHRVVSSPSRSQVMTQPPVPFRSYGDSLHAVQQIMELVQESICISAEKTRMKRMADLGEVDYRMPIRRKVRSRTL